MDIYPNKIISAARDGVERSVLVWARGRSLETGGWFPKNGGSGQGSVQNGFGLREMPVDGSRTAVERNIRESDLTVLCSVFPGLDDESLCAAQYAAGQKKPWIQLVWGGMDPRHFTDYLAFHKPGVLNLVETSGVADPRFIGYILKNLDAALVGHRPAAA